MNNNRLETELDDINATAYTNPFNDYINITSNTFIEESIVQIYNIQGKLVSEGQYNFGDNANQVIPTSDLKNGIYIVKVQTPYGKAKTFKMVKE